MRKAFRHTGVLMMLAVVALGLVGAAYTLWYQKLTLTTNISTGSLSAAWSFHPWSGAAGGEGTFSATSQDGNGKPVVAILTQSETQLNQGASHILGSGGTGTGAGRFTWGNFNPPSYNGVPTPAKPFPTCQGAMTPSGASTTLTLTLGGLFPFAGCEFEIDISNTGSVPFHLAVLSQVVKQCHSDGTDCSTVIPSTENLPWTRGVVPGSPNYDKCLALLNADWKGTLPQQVNLGNVDTGAPVQIHPGAGNDLVCDFMLVLDENWRNNSDPNGPFISDQNLAFQITTQYVAYQWNESPSPSVLSSLP